MSRNPPPFDLLRARAAYWAFHWGRPPRREFPVRGPRGIPTPVWQLGELVGLELRGGHDVWVRRGQVHLASDRFGERLYLVAEGPILVPHGPLPGRVLAIRYRTNKDDGGDLWRHAFEGRRPLFALDAQGWPVFRRAGSRFRITWRGIEG